MNSKCKQLLYKRCAIKLSDEVYWSQKNYYWKAKLTLWLQHFLHELSWSVILRFAVNVINKNKKYKKGATERFSLYVWYKSEYVKYKYLI